uniref:Hemoglobin linker chain L1 n=2 Tax=Lumbricus terrestris TaxID=6398 RepID=Q9GV76_LUMTE|nr:Chain C0, HEMOGLOBIN LINKER CHAIN L1 [Lumbricus terrestris]4V93_C5 Chain C5, HEMOGLOBIN LINKER CHAIN L1 [Lumbricus terrestris]4V93_CC Chain CC, HEMOGLOBIN LINKER CHAIN L1 [Lumbricus terrestris]4V93_CH Chain CH, HEMOGLOBIN LINKER CHAIN L1 [Lumbricus terrestris]4V93_CM Chain CM, HEMOGLOBIN LINKER CHAIN L1 [Lumbricus terrestris]4V93_CR Chain CR, HEMOGLOBIN LINKER CHAIN L1 [Lumbricus terrestris]4V93_CW Chain CW, HEMOGLOBIN LINKER CHAIN L1 [Lumbricus terrestris]4V93_Cb Chain Cb, HEMOGLOBIN LIN
MWYVLGLMLVGLAAGASDPYQERRFQYLVKNQNLHIDYLAKKLHDIEEEYNKLTHDVDKKTIRQLKARISNLEEHHCDEHESECRGDVPECIHDLLFCDGEKDCRDGSDEDPETCSLNITHVGSSYTGLATWTSCEDLNPDHAIVTITAAHRKSFFPNRVWLRATLSYELDEHDHTVSTTQLRGFYNFGKRELLLAPLKGQSEGYGVICDFNLGDDDHADCKIVVPSSLFVCAHFNAQRY